MTHKSRFILYIETCSVSILARVKNRLVVPAAPPRVCRPNRDMIQTVERDFGRYLRAELMQSLLVGLLLGLGYWALGSPYAALLAVIGALAKLIQVVGVLIAVLTPLLIGLLSSLQISLFSALLTVLVLLVIKLWGRPRLYHGQQQNPILTFFLLVAQADAFGLPGLIAAPPLAATIKSCGTCG